MWIESSYEVRVAVLVNVEHGPAGGYVKKVGAAVAVVAQTAGRIGVVPLTVLRGTGAQVGPVVPRNFGDRLAVLSGDAQQHLQDSEDEMCGHQTVIGVALLGT